MRIDNAVFDKHSDVESLELGPSHGKCSAQRMFSWATKDDYYIPAAEKKETLSCF